MRQAWFGVVAALLAAAWAGYRLWPRTLEFHPVVLIPVWDRTGERDILKLPGRHLVAEVGLYDDELFAYLMFQYFRGSKSLKEIEVLLTWQSVSGGLVYPVEVSLEDDLRASIHLLAKAQTDGLITRRGWRYVTEDTVSRLRYQTKVFVTAYNLTTPRKIEDMNRSELLAYARRFVLFKSAVDPRIRRGIEPVPRPLTNGEAHRLTADILTIADFYSLPLEFFLGIGAMENNFMNVVGDLQHAVWKKRAGRGDVVLKRRRGRVLVRNPALGVWQITRETLRYAHKLYLADHRDYSALPERLRPSEEPNPDDVAPEVLTTYAGLLFRHLLDRFQGDVSKAVGAYNGGPANPNARYGEGVRIIADHARQVMQQAAALHGRPAAGMQFLTPGR